MLWAEPHVRTESDDRVASADRPAVREARLALLAIDLAGYTRGVASMPALEVAAFLDRFYATCHATVVRAGGRVVKFMGDACFAVFPQDRCADAVEAVLALAHDRAAWANPWGMSLGANLHLGVVAEGEIGPADARRYDVVGAAVNHLFRMGGGAGVRVSEPVYLELPDERRSAFQKDAATATYTLAT